jgi:acetyl esterase/lipase
MTPHESSSSSASRAFHPDLRGARWLPRGVGHPFLVWLMRRLPFPSIRLSPRLTLSERRVDDAGNVRVRIIKPRSDSAPRPALLWIHGGGYVLGSARQDDELCARFAERLDAVVVSVDYRLAPEHPYPTPLDDCFAAFEFLHRHASELGIDPARVVIGGQSAGGGLAAALTLLVYDRKRPAPALQLLVYPMLDDRTVLEKVDGRFHRMWNQKSNAYGWRSYLGRPPGSPEITDHAAPARRASLVGLPPAWIGVGTLDLFHDEDLAYAARLREAGVPTRVEIVEGAFHGFDAVMPKRPVSERFFDSQVAAIETSIAPRRVGA